MSAAGGRLVCGIVGALDLRAERTFEARRLAAMAAALAHRGPDGQGTFTAPGIAMATRRLALVDPAGGAQPARDARGSVVVTANGELFDHRALRHELESAGHAVSGGGDTALWPALYRRDGERAFERAHGQFAVALWDHDTRTLLLARDRIGVCPLHVAQSADGWLLWASEIKGLLASGLIEPRLDLAGVDHVFALFAAGTRRTCFEGVRSLWPGHFLRVRDGRLEERRYWDLDFAPEDGARRTPELVAAMRETLERAVALRLEADAPVATLLSGGLDSTLLLGLARRVAPARALTSFTVGFRGAGPDELARARRSAALLGTRLEPVVVDAADIVGALPAVVTAAEGPVIDTANACVLLLARAVSERGFKAVISGEGADEALAGYVWHKVARVMRGLGRLDARLPRAVHELTSKFATPGQAAPSFVGRFGRRVRPAILELYEPLARARGLFYSDALRAAVRDHDPLAALDVSLECMRGWGPLEQGLYLEYKLMLPGHLLLGKGDRMLMQAAVEGRYPFLDEAFVALCGSLPASLKLRGWREKWLLRQVARQVLPAPIASPPKSMFKAHALAQLGPLPVWAEQLLSRESLERTGLFSPARVARERAIQRRLPAWAPRRFVADAAFTAVVTTQLFCHVFLGEGLCELPSWQPPDLSGTASASIRRQ